MNFIFRTNANELMKLWLNIFLKDEICQFSYEDIAIGRSGDIHPGTTQRVTFACEFPFFWIIKESIDSKWDNAKSIVGMYFHFL